MENMIDITKLTELDKGRKVVYKANHLGHKGEEGKITSWNDHYIFVDYYKTGKGTATMPINLTFVIEPGIEVPIVDKEGKLNKL